MTDTIIAPSPPNDGRDWDAQCARCGSSLGFEDCGSCGGEGVYGHECGEDTCCCADPEENATCGVCSGNGSFPVCISSPEWCAAHPMAGREKIERSTPEWFVVDEVARL